MSTKTHCGRVASIVLVIVAMNVHAIQMGRAQSSNSAATVYSTDDFYRDHVVQTVYLTIADHDLKHMLSALPERISVKGALRWRDISNIHQRP